MLFSVCSRIQLFLVLTFCGLAVASGETVRPPNAFVYVISPKDGDTVANPLGCNLVFLAWVLRPPASTRQTRVTTIC